jgi:hypothetical protein
MLSLVLLMLADAPETTTMPRRADPQTGQQQGSRQQNPADPYFDRPLVATDDGDFIGNAIESGRQGMTDARALDSAAPAGLRDVADKIQQQNEAATRRLAALAESKGWAIPPEVPSRTSSVGTGSPARRNAGFIVSQITSHETTIATYRAQIAGKGDPQLKKTLREVLPGYENNLRLLLSAKP